MAKWLLALPCEPLQLARDLVLLDVELLGIAMAWPESMDPIGELSEVGREDGAAVRGVGHVAAQAGSDHIDHSQLSLDVIAGSRWPAFCPRRRAFSSSSAAA